MNQRSILDIAPKLFWQGALLVIIIAPLLRRQHDIHTRAFASQNIGIQTVLVQVDHTTIYLVKHDSRHHAIDLQGEFGGLDDFNTTDKGVDDDGEVGAVVDGDGVGFVADFNDGFVTSGDQDRVRQLGRDLDDFRRVFVVFDKPFVAVEFLPRGLLGTHARWFGLFTRQG